MLFFVFVFICQLRISKSSWRVRLFARSFCSQVVFWQKKTLIFCFPLLFRRLRIETFDGWCFVVFEAFLSLFAIFFPNCGPSSRCFCCFVSFPNTFAKFRFFAHNCFCYFVVVLRMLSIFSWRCAFFAIFFLLFDFFACVRNSLFGSSSSLFSHFCHLPFFPWAYSFKFF